MINTKINLDTAVDTSLRIIADEWNVHSLCEKRKMMKELLLNPSEFPTAEQIDENRSFKDWIHDNEDDEDTCSVRYEMKQVLLDVLYEYAGEYAKRERPDSATGNFEDYENMMVKFWADVPQEIKRTILFGDCLIFSLESGMVVTNMESKTAHGDDDSFLYAMNQIMNHHLIEIGQYYSVDKIVSLKNPLNKINPDRVTQIENFIELLNKYIINAYDNDNLNASVNSTNVEAIHIWDAWIDDQGITLFCCDTSLENPTDIHLPINDILSIMIDPENEKNQTYTIKMTEDKTCNVVFSQGEENK